MTIPPRYTAEPDGPLKRFADRVGSRVDLVLIAALVVGVAVRVWEFGSIPPGLNQDEASTAYDAFSILNYGVDRSGFHIPLVLNSWGSGMYALASYLEMPFLAAFGLSITAARMAFLVAGVVAIPVFFSLLRESVDLRTARIGAVLLAISPWHIMISRWGLDSNMFPFMFLLGAACLVRSVKSERWLIPAFALIALSLYGYGTAYIAVPVFLGLCLAYGIRHELWRIATVAWSVAAFTVVALPIALYVMINRFGWDSIETPLFSIPRLTGVPRFESMSNIDVVDNLWVAIKLFTTQNDGLIWNSVPYFGIMYVFSTVLAVPGLAILCYRIYSKNTQKEFDPSFVLVAWSFAAIVLCAFLSMNINRANIAMFPFIACTAVTVSALWKHRWAVVVLGAAFAISFAAFLHTYFGSYRSEAAGAFYSSFGEAIKYAAAQTQGQICVTGDVNMPYIFVLFNTEADPREFAATVRYDNPGAEFQQVGSFDRYTFGLNRCPESTDVVIATNAEAQQIQAPGFTPRAFERYTVFTRDS